MNAQQPAPAAVAGVEEPGTQPEVTEPGLKAAEDTDDVGDQALANGSDEDDAVDEAAGDGQAEPVGDPPPKEAQTSLD